MRETELGAEIEYIRLQEDSFDLGDGIKLTTKYLNHPILSLGYRFEYQGRIFCTAYDTEPFRNIFSTDPDDPSYDENMAREGELIAAEQNEALAAFYAGADLLVHDCQYTEEEYNKDKAGWGHSFFEQVCPAAGRAGVRKLALFHHDPLRNDAMLDELTKLHCAPGKYGDTEIFMAREAMELTV